ncbi:DNA-protecting protein DprA [Lactobacillus sp. DCY120]|uniref:DNA-protecting protein DprA n=1 Tax=Bombilactobacillus apium TaxID=2675299 RepID=A0A850QYL7_9LACO|nr:DNA-processing protein DprA [Bombilactobacillus apium]NVY95773.1 DNA-protecting protein DprA [Bombilactobacillus apium]
MELRQLINRCVQTRIPSNRLLLKMSQYQRYTGSSSSQLLTWLEQQLSSERKELFQRRWGQQKENLRGSYLTFLDDNYPQKLREIYNPPVILYYQGNLRLLKTPTLAIVGARQCSHYTERIIKGLLPQLVHQKITTVSGLALGADACCHRETLFHQGATIAVLGNGLDYFYPRANQRLQKQIAQQGLLLSEYPPQTTPRRYYFPQRNRIIAGLCQSLLVTQARHRSGTLITAELALESNRNVWAVPGPIDSPLSLGCNELIAAGARPYLQAAELLTDFS